ncbi:MAG: transposase [Chitinophagaceae bacterium]|nr:MAG: transposase [Chitinophagaceae bacterium]
MAGDRYFITEQQDTYFITCTVVDWVDLFTRIVYKQIIVDSLNHCIKEKGLVLNGWVLMTNHLHFIARCEKPHRMSDFLRDFKKFTSKRLVTTIMDTEESRREWILDKFGFAARSTHRADNYKLWKDDNHAINLVDIDALEKLYYIHDNPVKTGIVENPADYLYSSARDYVGLPGLIKLEMI